MIHIAQLGPTDGPRLRAIRLRALADSPDAFGDTLEAASARTAEAWTTQVTDLPTFVAVVSGEDAGMVRAARDSADASSAWLLSMWVAPAHRRLGLGARLAGEVIGWARAQGCRRILLEVADENHAAIAFYASQGFAPNGGVGSLPPPREHILEHQRELSLE